MKLYEALRIVQMGVQNAVTGFTSLYTKTDGNLYLVSPGRGEAAIVPVETRVTTPTNPRLGQVWIDMVGSYAATTNFHVGPSAPDFGANVPGVWIQTGLGADGTGWTLWIEDGTT